VYKHVTCRSSSSLTQQPNSGPGVLLLRYQFYTHSNTHTHTHTHTHKHLAGLPCRRDQLVAEYSNYTTHKTHAVCGSWTRDPSIRAAADLCLNPHGRLLHSYIKIVCQWLSVRMLQNVMTVRYQRHTCSRVSQTPVVAASVMNGPFFTYLPLFHEGIFGTIDVRICEVFLWSILVWLKYNHPPI